MYDTLKFLILNSEKALLLSIWSEENPRSEMYLRNSAFKKIFNTKFIVFKIKNINIGLTLDGIVKIRAE